MKINVGKFTYFVHFETRKHRSQFGDKDLFDVACHIRTLSKATVAVGRVSQNYSDRCDLVYARKLAFHKALMGRFDKAERTEFWDAYKLECRYKKSSKKDNGYQKDIVSKIESECEV
jgi:hypothetical protein